MAVEATSLSGPQSASCIHIDPLYLRRNVFFCLTQEQGIFLDLERDMYSEIAMPEGLRGTAPLMAECAAAIALVAAHRAELLVEGLVTTDTAAGVSICSYRELKRAERNVFPGDARAFGLRRTGAPAPHVSVRDLMRFLFACQRASKALRTQPIAAVVDKVRKRKPSARATAGHVDALRKAAFKFAKLRPWYPRGYLCLFDSLALVEFLAANSLFPEWLFAVQAQPFGAHCWVQAEDLLLNESPEYAGQFTPIMSV